MAFNYDELCPGIREAVRWFHRRAWETTDSGDGSNASGGMACALDTPMVVVAVDSPQSLCPYAEVLLSSLCRALPEEDFKQVDVQAMFNPRDGIASILVTGDGLLKLKVS